MQALILGNSELYKPDVLLDRIRNDDFQLVIGVDAGARHASTLKVSPDVVVGDMDSLPKSERLDDKNIAFVSYPKEKNETDLELALLYAIGHGATKTVMVGVTGGRMEMTIANVLMMAHSSFYPCRIEVWHGDQTGWIITPPGADIQGNPGDTISLVSLNGDVTNISTRGLEYQLSNETLIFGLTRGISNILSESPAHVEFSKGLLLAVRTIS